MNTDTLTTPQIDLPKADRIGVAASVLCAIHCGLAPVLLIAMPAFGRIWAHPASHALVALFIVPLAAFSIRKGYRSHKKRWVMVFAIIGILFVIGGALLPAFTREIPVGNPPPQVAEIADTSESEEGACSESECETCASESGTAASSATSDEEAGCVDACCPSVQVSDTGQISLHIPPAAIVTTLGGIFLIAAHVGNLCGCAHVCRNGACGDCI